MQSKISHDGNGLIFLISQPRSGSTMMQKILASHPEIHTLSEPWLMLGSLFGAPQREFKAFFNYDLYQQAFGNFIANLKGGEGIYIDTLRHIYVDLYSAAVTDSGKSVFLDKTPRYYHIIPELYKVFPKAKFLILRRNPLAVLSSIINTWVAQNLITISDFKQDLLIAPNNLLNGIEYLGPNCYSFQFEAFLENPKLEIQKALDFLEVETDISILSYKSRNWEFGDQTSSVSKSYPDINNADKWISYLNKPQVWRLSQDYLNYLGQETIDCLGYSYDDLQSTLNAHKPSILQRMRTLPLSWILTSREERRVFEYEHYWIKLLSLFIR